MKGHGIMLLEKSLKGQAIIEYIVLFIVIAAAAIGLFGAFNPENNESSIKKSFDTAVSTAITEINKE